MIVRILSEGQYRVDAKQLDQIKAIDGELMKAVTDHDEPAFHRLMEELMAIVRRGDALGPDDLVESDLILPPHDMTIEEAKKFFADPLA
ncbi:MAG: hypothetical protein OWQ57_11220 [Sulfobacillus sp.]|nr:hypothetical protein [Sulfobacillus sp.]